MPDVPAPPNPNPECPCPAAMSKEKKDAVNWGRNNPVFQNPVAAQTSNAQGGFAAGLAKANQVSSVLSSLGGNTSQMTALSSRIGNMQGVLGNFSNQSNRLSGLPFTGNGPDLLSLVSTVTAAVDFQCALGIEGLDVGAKIGLVTEDGKMKLNVAIDVQADLNKLLDKLPQGSTSEPGFLEKMQEGLAGIQEGLNKITNKMDEVAGGLNNAMDQVSGMFDDALDFVTQFTNINFAINLSNDPCTKFGVGFKQGILNPAFIDQARNANPLKRALNPGFGSGALPAAANLPVGTQDAAASVASFPAPSIPQTPSEYAAQYESPQQKSERETKTKDAEVSAAANSDSTDTATNAKNQAILDAENEKIANSPNGKRKEAARKYKAVLAELEFVIKVTTDVEANQGFRGRLESMKKESNAIFPQGLDSPELGPSGIPFQLNLWTEQICKEQIDLESRTVVLRCRNLNPSLEKPIEGDLVPAGVPAEPPPNREPAAEPVATKETDAKNDGSMSAMDGDLKKWDKAATADGKSMNEVQKQDLVGEPEKAKTALKEAGLAEQPATDTPKSKRLAEIAARLRRIGQLQGDLRQNGGIQEEENLQAGLDGKQSGEEWMAPNGKKWLISEELIKKYQEEKNALFLERSNLEKIPETEKTFPLRENTTTTPHPAPKQEGDDDYNPMTKMWSKTLPPQERRYDPVLNKWIGLSP